MANPSPETANAMMSRPGHPNTWAPPTTHGLFIGQHAENETTGDIYILRVKPGGTRKIRTDWEWFLLASGVRLPDETQVKFAGTVQGTAGTSTSYLTDAGPFGGAPTATSVPIFYPVPIAERVRALGIFLNAQVPPGGLIVVAVSINGGPAVPPLETVYNPGEGGGRQILLPQGTGQLLTPPNDVFALVVAQSATDAQATYGVTAKLLFDIEP
jgi:hypothetical protein